MSNRTIGVTTVFVCYASEDRPLAEEIQLALTSAGHVVFFDEQSLPAGGDYQGRIEQAIARCDCFVFLASTSSLASGRFTLTELDFARRRWPSPVDRVLPVIVDEMKPSQLPAYLRAATVLSPKGSVAAETRSAVTALIDRRRSGVRRWVGAAMAGLVIAVAGYWAIGPHAQRSPAIADTAAVTRTPMPSTSMRGTIRMTSDVGDYIGGGRTHLLNDSLGLLSAQVTDSTVSISYEGDENWSFEFAAPRGKTLQPAQYLEAQRTPFNNPLKPGLSVSGASRGCNELKGEFTIVDLTRQSNGAPASIGVQFAQRCDGVAAALRGSISLEAVP